MVEVRGAPCGCDSGDASGAVEESVMNAMRAELPFLGKARFAKKKGRAFSPGQIFTRPPLGCAFWATTGAGFCAKLLRNASHFGWLAATDAYHKGQEWSFPHATVATTSHQA